MLLLIAFGLKAAIFPLFFWLPASYHTAPPAVSALFAGLLSKVGVFALIRTFTLIIPLTDTTRSVLLLIAVLTMVTGVLGAAAQGEFRRILGFHSVSQIGYMILGLAMFTPLALAGSVFYLVHHSIVKTNLFFVAGVVQQLRGTGELKKLGGLYAGRPALALLFLVSAMSLAGIPPLSGFWAKLILLQAGVAIGEYVAVGVAAGVGLLTLFSMTKIWAEAFWKEAPDDAGPLPERRGLFLLMAPVVVLAAGAVALGLGAGPIVDLFQSAAEQLMDRSAMIAAVLDGRAP